MKWLAIALVSLALWPSFAFAQVPQTLSYQGILTDGAGNLVADGNYSLTFRVYNVSTAGSALWTETQPTVAVAKGGFNVLLGGVTALTLPFDVPYWLGISVNGGAELSPRVALASSPYSLGLRLPFSGSASFAGSAMTIRNGGGGPAITADPGVNLGTTTSNGALKLFMNGAPSSVGRLDPYSTFGGELMLYDPAGNVTLQLQPDVSGGGGGYFNVGRSSSASGFIVDGNVAGTGTPRVSILGPSRSVVFDMTQPGDASVSLPANAIDAGEILDEPGIAQARPCCGPVTLNSTPAGSSQDLLSVVITTPASGYVELLADGFLTPGVAAQTIALQLSDVSGGPMLGTTEYLIGGWTGLTFDGHVPFSIHRTYFESAGAHTFYLPGVLNNGTSATFGNLTLTAHYFPTSYGSVTAEPSFATHSPSSAPIDLRELELAAANARARADEAARRLLEAREGNAAPGAAVAGPTRK